MTQTARPPVKWLVSLPVDDPYGDRAFRVACRGNGDLADVLNYFMFAASKEVENHKEVDTSCGTVTITRFLETICDYLKISKKTAIARIQKLMEWEFITSHAYHHRYDVHFKKIEVAIKNPPLPEKPKLRGRHAVKTTILTIPTILDGKEHEDCKELPDLPDGRIVVLENQIVNLQSQIVDLTSWIVNLQSQIVKLQSLQSSESTPQEAREAQIDPLNITKHYSNITEDIYVGVSDETTNAHTPSENENTSHQPPADDIAQASGDYPIATTPAQDSASVGVATRNTDSLVDVTQVAAPTRRRGSRKPKIKTPEDENMEQRITKVFECLDTLASEYAGEEFHYPPYKTDKEAVKTLLTSWKDLNPKQLSAVYRFMMDSPKSKSGWLWSEHMSVKAFCNNFAAEYAKMIGKGTSNGHANKETNAPSAAVAAGYTDYTNTPPTNYKPLPRKRA